MNTAEVYVNNEFKSMIKGNDLRLTKFFKWMRQAYCGNVYHLAPI